MPYISRNLEFPMSNLFKLRAPLTASQKWILGVVGLVLFVVVWWVLAEVFSAERPVIADGGYQLDLSELPDGSVRDSLLREDSIRFANATEFRKVYPILPPPNIVVSSYPKLLRFDGDNLLGNAAKSIWLNFKGYFWAVLISLLFGFLIGLIPLLRGLFSRQVDALRYLPLTALTGLFIIWFGIDDQMKVAFLAFGILVYLLPVVVQRIDEVKRVYLQTTYTLGATDWQTVKTVYLPSVLSKLIDDVRVLTAISWTYIIIVEYLNRTGGIGAMIYIKQRRSMVEEMCAILLLIILIGFLQDRLFVYLDRRFFPHKYYKTDSANVGEVKYGLFALLGIMALAILLGIFLPIAGTLQTILWILVVAVLVFIIFGEVKLRRNVANES